MSVFNIIFVRTTKYVLEKHFYALESLFDQSSKKKNKSLILKKEITTYYLFQKLNGVFDKVFFYEWMQAFSDTQLIVSNFEIKAEKRYQKNKWS